jgi:hypothetical protein
VIAVLVFAGCVEDDGNTESASETVGGSSGVESSTDSASGSGGTTSAGATTNGMVDCSGVELPGCDDVVEVCEGGDCSCLCADPATTGDPTGPGGECPPELPAGACEQSCEMEGASCGSVESCCGCIEHDVGLTFWTCGDVGGEGCPAEPPELDAPCTQRNADCYYCETGFVARQCREQVVGSDVELRWSEPLYECPNN